MVALEVFKDLFLVSVGRFGIGYLPLHVCSIGIFVFMFREYLPVEWNVITITPVNNRIETEIPDLKPEKGYRFKVFYTVRGETFMTEEQSFGTPAVPVPEISSAHFNISGNSVILTADISQTEFVTQSGFILLDNISFIFMNL